jgi:uncharacterized RDD family membrane protein YckC
MTAADQPARGRPIDDGWRAFVTPEGVDLRLRIGTYAERMNAFVIDMLILAAGLVAFSILLLVALVGEAAAYRGQALQVTWLLGVFGLRYFYFIAFELTPAAATPGKRVMGLRVVARDGGRLTADAVFARNAMRELEVFLPIGFLLARGEGIDAALILLGVVWSGVFILFPLFNRDRLRLGDIAAGTMVVRAPKRRLRLDLAQDGAAADVVGLVFAPAQLDAYGEKELHVLEDVLRQGDRRTLAEVARRIRGKIAWEGPADVSDRTFLQAYYTGLRGRLERGLLFGRRRRDKFDRG